MARPRRVQWLAVFAVAIAALVPISIWWGDDEVELPSGSEPSFAQTLVSDPWEVAARQRELAAQAWADEDVSATVAHAYQATLAAFETIREDATKHRAERGITLSESDIDIWEYARASAAVAEASMTWASAGRHMHPSDHAEDYARSAVALADARIARMSANDAWEVTGIYWDESQGYDTEQAWADATLAWAHAAESWAHAYELVFDFSATALEALLADG